MSYSIYRIALSLYLKNSITELNQATQGVLNRSCHHDVWCTFCR